MTWTRVHDAWIARECEGWALIESGDLAGMWKRPDLTVHRCPNYNLDPAAAIRAAEAWRKKKPGRWWVAQSPIDGLNPSPSAADCWDGRKHWASNDLAESLIRATGGPA